MPGLGDQSRSSSESGPDQPAFHSLWLTLRRAEKVSDDGVCIYANGDILSIFNESKVPKGPKDVHSKSAQLVSGNFLTLNKNLS